MPQELSEAFYRSDAWKRQQLAEYLTETVFREVGHLLDPEADSETQARLRRKILAALQLHAVEIP